VVRNRNSHRLGAQAAPLAPPDPRGFIQPASKAEDRLGQGRFVEAEPGNVIDELAVDNDGRHAADAVTTGRRRDVAIVHVANFNIVLGARQKLDQFYSPDAAGTAGCKDLDFSALSHVVLPRIPPAFSLWLEGSPATAAKLVFAYFIAIIFDEFMTALNRLGLTPSQLPF
jgi:hypothetical protein